MDQFYTLKFRRTLKSYFGQFVWIEKSHYYSRASLHEASTKNALDPKKKSESNDEQSEVWEN